MSFKCDEMSLIPWVLNDAFYRPRSALARWGWEDDDDFWSPWSNRDLRSLARLPDFLERQLASIPKDTGAAVNFDKDKFTASIDVQQFAPNEITVRTTGDNTIEVEGKHEERPDEHGYISRHFVRRYVLPKGHDVNQAVSSLSSDGVLTITAPKVGQNALESRTIPIQRSGAPAKAVENKK